MAGSVNDVDLHAVVEDGCVLGQNSDATLALEFIRIHDPLDMGFIRTECATLLEHGVYQRSLAVVYVRDDSDVANTRTQKIIFPWEMIFLLPLYYAGVSKCGVLL